MTRVKKILSPEEKQKRQNETEKYYQLPVFLSNGGNTSKNDITTASNRTT